MKDREKQLVRLDPSLYKRVCDQADLYGITKTQMLDRIVEAGLGHLALASLKKAA